VKVARDNTTVTMLVGDFKGGIEQNGTNLQAVSCSGQESGESVLMVLDRLWEIVRWLIQVLERE